MTDRPPLRCDQVEADLLTGPDTSSDARQIADHLVTCPACQALSQRVGRDRTQLRSYLDGADWLPVANRVFAALPHRRASRNDQAAVRMALRRTVGTPDRTTAIGDGWRRLPTVDRSPIATILRAACLLIVGLGLGLTLQQIWPLSNDGGPADATQLAATGGRDDALGAQPNTDQVVNRDDNSVYIPAPGDNPPLIVPDGTVGITASQNRATWQSVRHAVQAGISPVLYPPVPPGTFDSVVIETMATDAFAVRYAAEDIDILMTAGRPAGDVTVRSEGAYQATVRGSQATVSVIRTTVPGQGGLRLDGQTSSALAPGTVVEVTWTESGLPRDAAAGTSSTALPYRVTAAGLPVDVVMAFVDSLVPFGNGWDELRHDLPTGTTLTIPGTMPDGFGAASLTDHSVRAGEDGITFSYVITYQRVSGDAIDRIVFLAAPAEAPVEAVGLTVANHPAARSSTPATADRPRTETVTWQVGATRFRVDFTGGITDAEIDRVLDGITETTVALPAASTTGPSLPAPMGRLA